jgi:hypothetical protein
VTSLIGSKETDHHSPGFVTTSQLDRQTEDGRTDVPGTPDRADRVKFSNNATTYTNSGHWTSILDGVSLSNSSILKCFEAGVFAPAFDQTSRCEARKLQMHDTKPHELHPVSSLSSTAPSIY